MNLVTHIDENSLENAHVLGLEVVVFVAVELDFTAPT